jgi:hypothetical protein
MGDRAYAQVLCRAKDVAAFEELGFSEQEYWKGLPEGVSFLVDEEANYGNSSSLRELAERGYVFIAQHDSGGDYDAGRLVSDGKSFLEVDAMVHEPRPCVAVDADGFVDKKQLQAVRKLLARRRASEAAVGLRTGRDVGDAADCDIEAHVGQRRNSATTQKAPGPRRSRVCRVRPSGRTRVSIPASAASCLSGDPHAEAANETVRGLAVPP